MYQISQGPGMWIQQTSSDADAPEHVFTYKVNRRGYHSPLWLVTEHLPGTWFHVSQQRGSGSGGGGDGGHLESQRPLVAEPILHYKWQQLFCLLPTVLIPNLSSKHQWCCT